MVVSHRVSRRLIAAVTTVALACSTGVAAADTDTAKAPTRTVAPYRDPGLSSSPSSGEPGLSYALRGLSSKIVDPLGGLTGIVWITAMLVMLHTVYQSWLVQAQTAARLQGQPVPVDPLADLSSQLPPLPALSSQVPGLS